MGNPSMITGVTVPQARLTRSETLARAVGMGAADRLEHERRVNGEASDDVFQ